MALTLNVSFPRPSKEGRDLVDGRSMLRSGTWGLGRGIMKGQERQSLEGHLALLADVLHFEQMPQRHKLSPGHTNYGRKKTGVMGSSAC